MKSLPEWVEQLGVEVVDKPGYPHGELRWRGAAQAWVGCRATQADRVLFDGLRAAVVLGQSARDAAFEEVVREVKRLLAQPVQAAEPSWAEVRAYNRVLEAVGRLSPAALPQPELRDGVYDVLPGLEVLP